jgi:Aspartyl/Asparaginyl beta-hydroxylase/Tetratricopeptide repeat
MEMSGPQAEAAVRAGVDALRQGRAAEARRLFEQVAEAECPLPPPWFLLAQACRHSGDLPAAERALDRLLADEPLNIGALILKGDCRGRAGDTRAAVAFYMTALNAAPNAGPLSPLLAAELKRVEALAREAGGDFERKLDDHLAEAGIGPAQRSPRFQAALDILTGRKQVYLQEPSSFYFPGLPQIEFYERDGFPWLSEIEAAAPAMRAELEALIGSGEGFEPYVRRHVGRPKPVNPLFEDPSWSACYLFENGRPTEFAERCPGTLEALARAPMPVIEGRSPMALFSLLRPGTHIQPHHGLLNTRLICHVPLIAPPGCRLRVGGEVRGVEPGKALIFDDSFEHEAWNDGSETRVVLLFEIWRPEIAADERRALTAMFEAITLYQGAPRDY